MRNESISIGEIIELSKMFDEQTKGHTFEDNEIKNECFYDFVEQYINGSMNPQIRLV
jgi:hypothetical protein